MANFIPNIVKNSLWDSSLPSIIAGTWKGMFVDHADDTPAVTDDFIDDILSAARVPAIGSCPTIGSKTNGVVAVGTLDGGDLVFTSLTGDQSESLLLFLDTGVESTSMITTRWDTATGLPLTPNGGNVTAVFAGAGIHTAA